MINLDENLNSTATLLTAVAVDDEPKALELIGIHAARINFLDLKKSFRDPLEAVAWLKDHTVDLLFLDINMPQLSGLKFRSLIGGQTMIIFTTAYSEFAAESYELEATDYLLKPILFERFLKAVLKARSMKTPLPQTHQAPNWIYVKSGPKLWKLNVEEILFLEKDGNYIWFHTPDKKIMARLNIAQAMEMLPGTGFFRVHKSYIVALDRIDSLEPHQVTIRGRNIPVARNIRDELQRRMGTEF